MPEVTSPPQVAEFLIYLFDVRKCSARTIATYQSALGNVLRFTSRYDPGEDKVLSQLLKGIKRKRVPVIRRILSCQGSEKPVPHGRYGFENPEARHPQGAGGHGTAVQQAAPAIGRSQHGR